MMCSWASKVDEMSFTIMGRAEPLWMMRCRLAPDRSLTPTLSRRARERTCCASFMVTFGCGAKACVATR